MATKDTATKIKRLFGKRLRAFRTSKGLSQEALAAIAGLDRTYVSSCERGERNLTLLSLVKLAEALDIDPAELVRKS
jgi:transcriptional regulator with XRE-family HTH domain